MSTLKKGFIAGGKTSWTLSKVIFPITFNCNNFAIYTSITLDY